MSASELLMRLISCLAVFSALLIGTGFFAVLLAPVVVSL
jgi:hypothetical protein